jgi:hypothetical protein
MTTLLQEMFEKASRLPEEQQDVLAREFLQEIDWEDRWEQTLAESGDSVDSLAAEAIREFENGRTEEKGLDEL